MLKKTREKLLRKKRTNSSKRKSHLRIGEKLMKMD
jgi:hypothetical protein